MKFANSWSGGMIPAILAHQNNERIFYFTIQNAKQTINRMGN
jgi:hypothetical protein